MADITWTDQALADVEAVCLYIRVFQTTGRLMAFPRLGRVVPEIGRDDIREVIVQSCRAIYRLLSDEVEILTVHHGASLLTDFEPPNGA